MVRIVVTFAAAVFLFGGGAALAFFALFAPGTAVVSLE